MDICGACERIRNTPLSSSYRALVRHGIAIYLAIAPFYLIEDTGLAGLPMFVLAAYFLVGIELVAEEIEEPFGPGGDNLPLERYCLTIANSVREILETANISLSSSSSNSSSASGWSGSSGLKKGRPDPSGRAALPSPSVSGGPDLKVGCLFTKHTKQRLAPCNIPT